MKPTYLAVMSLALVATIYAGMRVAVIALLVGLTGCTTSGGWFQRDDDPPPPVAAQPIPQQSAPQQAAPRVTPNKGNMSPAAAAAAPPDATAGNGALMECLTQSCKINCSPKVPAHARPKWCSLYEEPTQ